MAKQSRLTQSLYTREALGLLAALIRQARVEKPMTTQELAARAGISRGLVQRIEQADPSCSIGAVFEVASLLGVSLFEAEVSGLAQKRQQVQSRLALLPKSVRRSKGEEVDDDF